jgi:hypothetical protein
LVPVNLSGLIDGFEGSSEYVRRARSGGIERCSAGGPASPKRMSQRLSGLLGDDDWKRCLEKLRPPADVPRDLPAIRTYVKPAAVPDEDNLLSDGSAMVVVRQARAATVEAEVEPARAKAAASERNEMGWVWEFVDAQVEDLKPLILQDSSKRYSYTQVSIKGARHEQQDALSRYVHGLSRACSEQEPGCKAVRFSSTPGDSGVPCVKRCSGCLYV